MRYKTTLLAAATLLLTTASVATAGAAPLTPTPKHQQERYEHCIAVSAKIGQEGGIYCRHCVAVSAKIGQEGGFYCWYQKIAPSQPAS